MRRAIDRPSRITGDRASHASYGVGPATDYAQLSGQPNSAINGARVKAPFPGVCSPYLTYTGGPGVIVTLGSWQFFCQHMGDAGRPSGQVGEGQDLGFITKAGALWDGYHWHAYVIAAGVRLSMEEFYASNGFVGGSLGDTVQPTLTSLSGGGTTPFPEEEDFMAMSQADYDYMLNAIRRGSAGRLYYDAGPFGEWPFDDPKVTRAVIGRDGRVVKLPESATDRKALIELERGAGDGIFLAPAEQPDAMTTVAFLRTVDFQQGPLEQAYGEFVENTIAVEAGSTRQVRTAGFTAEYANRQQVWRDGRPVRITKGGKTIERFVKVGVNAYAILEGGERVSLTTAEATRADAQRASGQTWASA